jgi:putative oxidoreductase
MDVVFLIGRILIAFLFLGSALAHLTQTDAMAGYAQSRGIPAAKPAVLGSGLLILVGALLVLLGVWGDLGALFLVLFLAPTAFLMHSFWKENDAMAKQMEMVQFNKDIALAGAALALFVVFHGDPGITITGPLFT